MPHPDDKYITPYQGSAYGGVKGEHQRMLRAQARKRRKFRRANGIVDPRDMTRQQGSKTPGLTPEQDKFLSVASFLALLSLFIIIPLIALA